jgi:hypothetical protein
MDIRFARSARRHRVGIANIVAAMTAGGDPQRIPATGQGQRERLVWIGPDTTGRELEIVAVVLGADEVMVIHAMPTHFRRPR